MKALDRGTGLSKGSITDRTSVAMFGAGAALPRASSADVTFEARQLSDAVKSGALVIVPQGWTIDMVMKADADARLFKQKAGAP